MSADAEGWHDYSVWLLWPEGGACRYAKPLPCGLRYAGVKRLIYHWTVIVGRIGDRECLDERYCYETEAGAIEGMKALAEGREPEGWHRHPTTGRRRPGGDAALEYIEW